MRNQLFANIQVATPVTKKLLGRTTSIYNIRNHLFTNMHLATPVTKKLLSRTCENMKSYIKIPKKKHISHAGSVSTLTKCLDHAVSLFSCISLFKRRVISILLKIIREI